MIGRIKLFAPSILEETIHIISGFPTNDMVIDCKAAIRETTQQGRSDRLSLIDVDLVGGLERKAFNFDDFSQVPFFCFDGGVINMPRIGNKFRSAALSP